MRTIEEAAKESASKVYNTMMLKEFRPIYEAGFLDCAKFIQRWIPVEEELPEVTPFSNGTIDNKDLLILKCIKYDSYEFGVLRELKGKKYWEIPDVGSFKIDEISHWRQIELK